MRGWLYGLEVTFSHTKFYSFREHETVYPLVFFTAVLPLYCILKAYLVCFFSCLLQINCSYHIVEVYLTFEGERYDTLSANAGRQNTHTQKYSSSQDSI